MQRPSPLAYAVLAVLTLPLHVLVMRTSDPLAHQAAITACGLIATFIAVYSAARGRSAPQFALACGITLWTAGSAIGTVQFAQDTYNHYPTLAEWFYLASYPALWTAVMLMVPRWGAGHWLDGIVACLGVAAVGAAMLMPKLTYAGIDSLGAAVATAFVIGDLLLLGFTAAALLLARRWRRLEWRRLAIGILLLAGTDIVFAARIAGSNIYTGWMDAGWTIGLLALALVQPRRRPHGEPTGTRQPVIPALCTSAALVILVVDHYHRISDGALWLAIAALALGVARTVDAARSGARADEAERLALTDELTRLGNRRRLFRDLGGALETGTAVRLGLFDLNGFKALNDTHGHVAGDILLRDLGSRLSAAVDGAGSAYRLGGDEFCVLVDADAAPAFDRALDALASSEHVTAAFGSVLLPVEAGDPTAALRLADARMYADKTR